MQNEDQAQAEDKQASERMTATKVRTHSKYPLPSERHAFDVHFEVLRQFVVRSRNGQEAVGADSVEGGSVPAQAASLNVRFLTTVGLLRFVEKGRYVPTEAAVRFVTARSVSDEKARPILRPLIEPTWFGDLAARVLQTRPSITEDEFVGELALDAQTDKVKKEPALRILVEYLVFSGVLVRDDQRNLSLVRAPDATVRPVAVEPSGLVIPVLTPIDIARGSAQNSVDPVDWQTIQTDDFIVKVRSDLSVLDDLRGYIDLLERKVRRSKSGGAPEGAPR